MTTYKTELEVQEAILRVIENGGPDDFSGNNCGDFDDLNSCLGWDGTSRRCDCGNRRVTWQIEQNELGEYYFYAEAW